MPSILKVITAGIIDPAEAVRTKEVITKTTAPAIITGQEEKGKIAQTVHETAPASPEAASVLGYSIPDETTKKQQRG